jgi:hypothetical protein
LYFLNPPIYRGRLFTTRLPDGQEVNGNERTQIQHCCDFIAPDSFGASCLLFPKGSQWEARWFGFLKSINKLGFSHTPIYID